MPYVYKYTDKTDKKVKYIGIIKKDSNFPNRFQQHKKDWWYSEGDWLISYIEVSTQTDAEALEAHLIEYYKTTKFYNRAKAGWGLSVYLPNAEDLNWTPVESKLDGDEELSVIELWNKADRIMRSTLEENDMIRDKFRRNSLYLWFVECGNSLMRKQKHLSKEECFANYNDFRNNYGEECEGLYQFPDKEEFWTDICKVKVTKPYRCKEHLTADITECLRLYYESERE